MKRISTATLILFLSLVFIWGCDQLTGPVGPSHHDAPQLSSTTDTFTPIYESTVRNYNITAHPGVYDENMNVTRFSYSVSYAGTGPSSNNFYLEVPECAIGSFRRDLLGSPTNSSAVFPYDDPRSGTTGVYWNSSLSRQTSNFTLTFDGNIRQGNISATVESGNRGDTGFIAGPCKGNEEPIVFYEVSGYVFVDVDASLAKDSYETGIFNVVLRLQGTGYDEIVTTDVFGKYSFMAPASSSDYTLTIPRTINGEEFNQQFFESYDYSGANLNADDEPETTITVVDSDQSFDFPFLAKTDKLVEQFEGREILTAARDFAFWRKMVRHAANETQGEVEIPKEDIYRYLYLIEEDDFFTRIPAGILPSNPFVFEGSTDAERARYALDTFLFNPSDENKTPLELFLRELLLAELNIVSGNGVRGFRLNTGEACVGGDPFDFEGATYCSANIEEFHLALLAFGEGLAAEILGGGTAESQKLSTSTVSSTSLDDGTRVFSSFNRTGTGGLD
jgi:hypothetical protein